MNIQEIKAKRTALETLYNRINKEMKGSISSSLSFDDGEIRIWDETQFGEKRIMDIFTEVLLNCVHNQKEQIYEETGISFNSLVTIKDEKLLFRIFTYIPEHSSSLILEYEQQFQDQAEKIYEENKL